MMDQRKQLRQFVRKAKRSLNFEYTLPKLQFGILIGLSISTAILVVSRLFIFPHYDDVAIIVGIGTLLTTLFFIWWNRVRDKDALHQLDLFYPHNELLTALSFKDDMNPLVSSLLEKAQKESPAAFEQFKKRKKELFKVKSLVGILLMAIIIGVLLIFPSATQQEAKVIEKEQDVIDKLEKEVAKLEKKKQLQELSNKLKDTEISEEALREVVKKQKELKLQEQKLKEKESALEQGGSEGSDGLTEEEQAQLKELMELQNELASTANSTQSALSKLGKPISFDLQNAIASELGSQSKNEASNNGSTSNNQNNNQSKNQNGSQQQGNGKNSNQQGQNGQGQGNKGSGQGQGSNGSSGSGQGSGSGNGGGQGSGSGKGAGQGTGGGGAGLGQGSRNLLSIPERIGGGSEPTVDGGPLNEGEPIGEQKGPVPVTKGTIRPYEEVIGQYKESYIESSDRIQLPKDLQDIVQSYFSSIESNE